MWILSYRDVRYSSCFEAINVAKADSKEKLVVFVEKERCPTYTLDIPSQWGPHQVSKQFKEGGPLEWAHPEHINYEDLGTRDEAAAEAAYKAMDQWDYFTNTTRDVSYYDKDLVYGYYS